ncbi:MAG TPA: GNAT family N-acetyltransferase, partial [Ktedonobacteraceae bacterium]|nr:GNAT family N-acetyltransferase [Ktedonobacteraceae bacterium]
MNSILVEDLTVRPATIEDITILYGLTQAYDYAQYGEPDFTLADVRGLLSGPRMNLTEDSLLAFDKTGQLVGVLILEHARYAKFFAMVRILPGYEDPQLENFFFNYAERWAYERMSQAEPGVRVTLATWATARDLAARRTIEEAGFKEIRRFWRMEIEMSEAPQTPQWPEGVELRPFILERDAHAVFEAIEAAFSDHWGFVAHQFDEWQHWAIKRESFDPSFWFIAYEGDQIVGASLCVNEDTLGWVDTLGVLRPWRRKGLGQT